VHVSQLAHKFVNDAREVVKTGDIVKVQVQEVDVARKRISLTMKIGAAPAGGTRAGGQKDGENRFQSPGRGERHQGNYRDNAAVGGSAMASAFAKLKR
jgi:protein Tex